MRPMKPEDLYRLSWAADPRLSPDGTTAAFTVTRIDEGSNSYVSDIYLTAADGSGEPRRFTHSGKADANPRWSPDGSRIAFTSNRRGDNAELYVMPVAGGEPVRVTGFDESVEDLAWSPAGDAIALTVRVRDEAYEEEDERKRRPRRITRLSYMLDDVGWTFDRPRHVFVVAPEEGAEPRQVTEGESEVESFSWAPDGSRIAFASARHEDFDIVPRSDIYVVAAAGGQPERLTPNDGVCRAPSWSPDGTRIAYQTFIGPDWDYPRHTQIAVLEVGSGARTLLTESLDRDCAPYPHIREPIWSGDEVFFAVEDSGNTLLYKAPADGAGKPEPVIEGDLWVTGYDVREGVAVHTTTTPDMPAELHVGQARVTHVGEGFTSEVAASRPERYIATSKDGSEVECWIMRPYGFEEGRRYPVLLNIHGGPFSQYGNRFFDEFQVYAGAGYAVVYCNPRGSSGYSEEWGRAIRGPSGGIGPGMGSVDFEDVMACIDTALDRYGFCDPERVGVMGGSYGGFMTSWIVGHSDRFKAAVSERAVNNWLSFFGSSDDGPFFKAEIGAWPFEDTEALLRISPSTYATSIDTPLLIMHSEKDLRCNIEQAQHLFAILRLRRKEVEFVRFPAESHELSRSGSPSHRVQRFEIILDWFARHLGEDQPKKTSAVS